VDILLGQIPPNITFVSADGTAFSDLLSRKVRTDISEYTTGVMARPEIRYTKLESKRGFTLDTIGFATVETEPKSKAPIIADV
jgi:hypothetical protein